MSRSQHQTLAVAVLVAGSLCLSDLAAAVDVTDTRLLSEPAISARHVAFAYAGDLWVASRDGGAARRLTSDVGEENNPAFSPDGELVAFSAEYDGNTDVYVVPVAGGMPRRLTWHPAPDQVEGFTPDGKAVLFSSPRQVFTNRHTQFFTVPVDGGFPSRLPIPHGLRGDWSPDGTRIAYIPVAERHTQWKGYRGGTTSRIWIYDTRDHSVVEVPQPETRCNDTDPTWLGNRVYFRSDRDGEINVYSFDPSTGGGGAVTRHTRFEDFPVLALGGDGSSTLVLEQAGSLHLLDPAKGEAERLRIGVAADLVETRPRWVDGAEWIRGADLSPSGARAVFEYRGEIVTLPAKKGDARNVTQTTAVHERSPVWSPDGKLLAFFSDEGGEYQLHLAPQGGTVIPGEKTRKLKVEGNGFYFDPEWSPDGKKISYTDNSQSVYWVDLASGKSKLVASEPYYRPGLAGPDHSWSPDSRWLAYRVHTEAAIGQVFVYDTRSGESHAVTDGLSDVAEPVFDRSGKYLYFFASTDAGPVKDWFAMSNADVDLNNTVYLAVLRAGDPSPLAPESDEEGAAGKDPDKAEKKDDESPEEEVIGDTAPAKRGGKDQTASATDAAADAAAAPKAVEPVRIDFDGLGQRILALPVPAAFHVGLRAGEAGKVYYLRRSNAGPRPRFALHTFSLDEREETELLAGLDAFTLSGDGKKLLWADGETWGIAGSGGKVDRGETKIAVEKIQVRVDPPAEWRQIYDEAWRINRDYFYDPGMHGADWTAMGERYEQFLDHLATRADLNRVLQWMSSELAVGHHRNAGGDRRNEAKEVPGGLLGADIEIDQGRYRFARVYGGLNWNPDLRAPLTEPGVDVREGEYLLAVDGVDLDASENVYARFENTAGKIVRLTVGGDPTGKGSRVVEVVPIANESALRNRAWVEGNLRKVDQATGGRVAYVYVPNTTFQGHQYFKRYFYPQANKQAIIVDERFNGGGQVADYYIDHLRRPFISHWATRYGKDIVTPSAAIFGPKVMIIDETAGSGGDLLPWMFRKLDLGTLVGKRTWGGLVGVLGFPVLLDGGVITAPNLAIWTEDGFIVENEGVPPDVEVEQWPAEVIAGRDPQLERAIEIVLEQLEKSPPATAKRPPFPVRAPQ
jgi:tricorn protease